MTQIEQLVDPLANTMRLFTPPRKKQKRVVVINEKAPYTKYIHNVFITSRMLTPEQALAIWSDNRYRTIREEWLRRYHITKDDGSCPSSSSWVLEMKKEAMLYRDEILKENNLPPIL